MDKYPIGSYDVVNGKTVRLEKGKDSSERK